MQVGSAQKWIDGSSGGPIDMQYTTAESVCIDRDATWLDLPNYDDYGGTPLKFGSLECLDEPDWVFRYDSYKLFSCS